MASPLTQSIRPASQGGDFTSLAAWESQNLDLVTLDSSSYAMIDGNWSGSLDTSAVAMASWTTDLTHSVTIECIGTGSRHNGYWDYSKYVLSVDTSNAPFRSLINNLYVNGLQIENPNSTSTSNTGLKIEDALDTGSNYYANCIVRVYPNTGNKHFYTYSATNRTNYFINCIASHYGFVSQSSNIGFYMQYSNNYLYNCNAFGFSTGYRKVNYTSYVYNCIADACSTYGFLGSWDATSANNFSNVGDAPGSSPFSGSILYLNTSSADTLNLQLSPYDTVAKGAGIDLYNLGIVTFNTDIAGNTRTSGSWDIGAWTAAISAGIIYVYSQANSGFFFP